MSIDSDVIFIRNETKYMRDYVVEVIWVTWTITIVLVMGGVEPSLSNRFPFSRQDQLVNPHMQAGDDIAGFSLVREKG